jgi:hypothetical protein
MRILTAEDEKIGTKDREGSGPPDSLVPAVKRWIEALEKPFKD